MLGPLTSANSWSVYSKLNQYNVSVNKDLGMKTKVFLFQKVMGEISSERDGTKKMMKNLNIIQISHLTFECS